MNDRNRTVLAIFLMALGTLLFLIYLLTPEPGEQDTFDILMIMLGIVLAFIGWWILVCKALGGIFTGIDQGLIRPRRNYLSQWQHLRIGMTESEVRQLIGSPRQIEALVAMTGEMASRWHYGTLLTKGTITFHGDRIISFSAPRM
jgi:hypothetical protein